MDRNRAERAAKDIAYVSDLTVGMRVMRQRVGGNAGLGFLHGVIVAVRPRFGLPPLFDVRWDHDTTSIDKGYLRHGLMLEIIN